MKRKNLSKILHKINIFDDLQINKLIPNCNKLVVIFFL